FLTALHFFCYAQDSKRDNTWMLGAYGNNNSGINFNNGFADTFSVIRQTEFFLANASICDTNGQILFYTNGNFVLDRFHNFMTNTTGFNPGHDNDYNYPYGSSIPQAIIIIPRPQNPDKYLIIHESADTFYSHNTFQEQPLNLSY